MENFNSKLEPFFTKKKQLSLYRFSLPFTKPIKFKNHCLTSREGLWLVQHNSQGDDFIGEISPLPAFSQETLAQCEQQILMSLQGKRTDLTLSPSIHFALFCLNQKVPYQQPNQTPDLTTVPLLQGTQPEIKARYQALNGPNLVKLKVARDSVDEEIQILQSLIAINPKIRFRLDANQQWSAAQYSIFLKKIDSKYIDYIEEPTFSFIDNLAISNQFNVQIGLDESLLSETETPINDCIKALIIKPTLIGHTPKIQALLKHAQEQQLSVSISASFESPLAINQLHQLALQWQQKYKIEITLGLDTLHAFETNYFKSNSPSESLKSTLINKAVCLWHN